MHIFSKNCYCRSYTVPFRSTEKFDEHAIANVFCPICSDRAPGEAFMVAVTGVPGWCGIYGIDWNQRFLEERDALFADSEAYYKNLFSSGGVTFGFLPAASSARAYDALGIREALPSDELPPDRAGRLEKNEECSKISSSRQCGRSIRATRRRPRGLNE
jgi:hypothetical protein